MMAKERKAKPIILVILWQKRPIYPYLYGFEPLSGRSRLLPQRQRSLTQWECFFTKFHCRWAFVHRKIEERSTYEILRIPFPEVSSNGFPADDRLSAHGSGPAQPM